MSQVYIRIYYIGTAGKKQCRKFVFPGEFMSQVDGRDRDKIAFPLEGGRHETNIQPVMAVPDTITVGPSAPPMTP